MPIVFECSGCTKPLQVPDAAAGKKTRCPACGAIATAPLPPPQFEVVEAPPLPPPRPVARPVEVKNTPAAMRPPKPAPEEDATPMTLAEPDRPRKKRRRRLKPSRVVHHDEDGSLAEFRGKQILYIGGGALFLAVGIFALLYADRPSRGLWPIIVGVCLIVRGLTGDFD